MEPLNPVLLNALQTIFGRVRVSKQGEERQVAYFPDYTTGKPRMRANTAEGGEEYVLNCPFCGDRRGRFYVNHAWGTYDTVTGSWNYHLIHCFNEDCHLKSSRRTAIAFAT